MTERRIGILRRTSLKDVADGWDDCFLTYRPASLGELAKSQEIDPKNMTDQQGVDFLVNFVKDHMVSGQVMIADDNGTLTSSKLEKNDIDYFPADVLNQLFADITGAKLIPKGTPTPDKQPELPSESAGKPTETPSSTEPAA